MGNDAHLIIQILSLAGTVVGAAIVIIGQVQKRIDVLSASMHESVEDVRKDMIAVLKVYEQRLYNLEKEHWEMKGKTHALFRCRADDPGPKISSHDPTVD